MTTTARPTARVSDEMILTAVILNERYRLEQKGNRKTDDKNRPRCEMQMRVRHLVALWTFYDNTCAVA